jgi:hypothetical protein
MVTVFAAAIEQVKNVTAIKDVEKNFFMGIYSLSSEKVRDNFDYKSNIIGYKYV